MHFHDEESQLLECKGILEQLNVLKLVAIKEHVAEVICDFDFLLLDDARANLNHCFLQVFGHLNAHVNKAFVRLIEGIIGHPEVGVLALVSMRERSIAVTDNGADT